MQRGKYTEDICWGSADKKPRVLEKKEKKMEPTTAARQSGTIKTTPTGEGDKGLEFWGKDDGV